MYDDGSISGHLAAREADWAHQLTRRRAAVARWRGISAAGVRDAEEMLGTSWGHQRRSIRANETTANGIGMAQCRAVAGIE